MSDTRRIGILSIGNVPMSDDGIGPFILKILESRYKSPANVVRVPPGLRERALRPSICWWDNVSSGGPEEEDYVPGYSG